MKRNKFIYVLSALFLFTCVSCEDLLTEEPDSYYKKENYFVSASNAGMAITGIYDVLAKLEHYGQNEMAMPCSDDTYYIQGTGSDNTRRDIAHYTVKPNNTWIYSVWKCKYQGIERANFAIDGIMSMPGYETDKQLIGYVAEARFLRALLAFDLVRYFGDVPFKTTYSENYADAYQPRKNREDIYDQIISDLNFAKENLDWATAASTPERVTQGAARALLMRVYLQRAGYSLQLDGNLTRPDDSKRATYFTEVTNEWKEFVKNGYHGFYPDGGYPELFKSFSAGTLNSKESLFEIAFFTPSGTSEDAGTWGTYNGPIVEAPGIKPTETGNYMGRANGFFRVVPEWKDFFEDNDQRRDVMTCTYQYTWNKSAYKHEIKQNKKKDWYPGKWRREWMPLGYKDPNNVDVNFCYLRYADVVLMAAEAYNELKDPGTAWGLINDVRKRAGATTATNANYVTFYKAPKVHDLPFIDDSDEAGKIRTALYWERGFELAFEGQRKYDLVRWGILSESLKLFQEKISTEINKGKSIAYPAGDNFIKGQHELFPIPLDEIQINPKLENKNNPGY